MPPIVLVDNPFVTLWYHGDTKIIHHQIHQFIYGAVFREFLMVGADALKKNRATKWLSDDRDNTVLSHEDADWGRDNWIVPTVKAGWKHWAVVRPRKVLGQMSMDRGAKEMAALGVNIRFFDDPVEAMQWLEAQ